MIRRLWFCVLLRRHTYPLYLKLPSGMDGTVGTYNVGPHRRCQRCLRRKHDRT